MLGLHGHAASRLRVAVKKIVFIASALAGSLLLLAFTTITTSPRHPTQTPPRSLVVLSTGSGELMMAAQRNSRLASGSPANQLLRPCSVRSSPELRLARRRLQAGFQLSVGLERIFPERGESLHAQGDLLPLRLDGSWHERRRADGRGETERPHRSGRHLFMLAGRL